MAANPTDRPLSLWLVGGIVLLVAAVLRIAAEIVNAVDGFRLYPATFHTKVQVVAQVFSSVDGLLLLAAATTLLVATRAGDRRAGLGTWLRLTALLSVLTTAVAVYAAADPVSRLALSAGAAPTSGGGPLGTVTGTAHLGSLLASAATALLACFAALLCWQALLTVRQAA